jgi:glycine/D-amino acid oxidase-like deaminating enzyme
MYESHGQVIAYGVPDIGSGVKTAIHYVGTVTDAETVDRAVSEDDIAPVRELLQRIQPDVVGEVRRGVVCLYTCTPDYDFIVDKHPDHDNVIIASICSSQGFKYSAAFGEALAELAVDGHTSLDISPWRLSRFTQAK